MKPREFAFQITEKLQTAGYQAFWAGGCVRDQMLGLDPKDYDVATSAKPEEVRELFGYRRTIAIGAAFGVITVLGPKSAGPIEVATFRRDADYSDGRHPDSIEFTNAREDALRRDFTINGMFFDPIGQEVHDYVDGQTDLHLKRIRAIGDPNDRIDEDKLRMLRAIRFASTYRFQIDPVTLAAIQAHASEIRLVSSERIGAEMRRMLAHNNRAAAAVLLRDSGLLATSLRQGAELYQSEAQWKQMVEALSRLSRDEFACAATILLEPVVSELESIAEQWRLSNDEKASIRWMSQHFMEIASAHRQPWSQVQPILIHRDAEKAVEVCAAVTAEVEDSDAFEGISFCRKKLAMPPNELNPPPLIDGNDLKQLGFAGPHLGAVLKTIRAEQLDAALGTKEEAILRARELANK